MDPWLGTKLTLPDSSNKSPNFFEDDFKPTISHTLPDSQQYLATLENKLHKLKNDPDVLKQLAEKRSACMQELLQGTSDFERDSENLDCPLNTPAFIRAVLPEQALTAGEIVELVKYDRLNSEDKEDSSDAASR